MMSKYRPINDCFEVSDKIRAKHLLFEDYFHGERKGEYLPAMKLAFYLWLNKNELSAKWGKDENGDFGHGLKFISNKANTLNK